MDWFDLSRTEQEEYMVWAENLMNDPDPLSSEDLSHLSTDEQRSFLGLLEYNDDSLSDIQIGRIARFLYWADQKSEGIQETTVKLTKKQLKKIIREEKNKLHENQDDWVNLENAIYNAMKNLGEQRVLQYLRSFSESY